MAVTNRDSRVTVTPRAMWRLRLARELPNRLLQALAVAGLLASARFAIAPPQAKLPSAALHIPAAPDRGAEGFASLFARRYLSWDAHDLEAHRNALAGFLGAGMDPDAGMQPPVTGKQEVQWTEVVQDRVPARGEHVYTVAAQTDEAGLLYLTVSVRRSPAGVLALAGYPAFVGAPASAPAMGIDGEHLREIEDPALATMLQRAMRNYLAGSRSDLAADLTSTAHVALPGIALALRSVTRLAWAPGGGSALAVVQAQDARGAQYALAYELDVSRAQGRWEISAIQTNPDS